MATNDKKKAPEAPKPSTAAPVRSPRGDLPRKKRPATTAGTETVKDPREGTKQRRYSPSKRVKALHRDAMKTEGKVPLRKFVRESEAAAAIVATTLDWKQNKKASGKNR